MTILTVITFYLMMGLGLAAVVCMAWKHWIWGVFVVLGLMSIIGGYTLDGLGTRSWLDSYLDKGEGAWGNFYQLAYDGPFYLGYCLLAVAGAIGLVGWFKNRDMRIKNRAAIPNVELGANERTNNLANSSMITMVGGPDRDPEWGRRS